MGLTARTLSTPPRAGRREKRRFFPFRGEARFWPGRQIGMRFDEMQATGQVLAFGRADC